MIVQRLFSKNKENNSNSSAVKGAILAGGGFVGNSLLFSRGNKKLKDSLKAENDKLTEKLENIAKKQGTKTKNIPNLPINEAAYYPKENTILHRGEADILAHELGHSKHYNGRNGSKIGKLAHKLYPVSSIGAVSPVGLPISLVNGYKSGKNAAKAEKEGKKESTWNKYRAVAVPLAISTPVLVAEGAASRKGLKMLKESGASKEFMRNSKKRLLNNYGTYATASAANAGVGELGRAAGKKDGREER